MPGRAMGLPAPLAVYQGRLGEVKRQVTAPDVSVSVWGGRPGGALSRVLCVIGPTGPLQCLLLRRKEVPSKTTGPTR